MTAREIFDGVLIGALIAAAAFGGAVYAASGLGKPWCVAWRWPAIGGLDRAEIQSIAAPPAADLEPPP